MADSEKRELTRGVIVEFDFTAVDGAQLLFETAKSVLKKYGVDLTIKLEALHLAGGNSQGAFAELFRKLGVQAEAAAVAKEVNEAFNAALTLQVAGAVTPAFKAFVKTLTDRGVKVVVATRADIEVLKPALEGLDVVPYAEVATTYGGCKWDAWRRACNSNSLVNVLTAAVTGSGHGVKSALLAGLSAAAVIHPHVAYQDFGGSDVAVEAFSADLAKEVLVMLHL